MCVGREGECDRYNTKPRDREEMNRGGKEWEGGVETEVENAVDEGNFSVYWKWTGGVVLVQLRRASHV